VPRETRKIPKRGCWEWEEEVIENSQEVAENFLRSCSELLEKFLRASEEVPGILQRVTGTPEKLLGAS
jgi:hypothetical protein